MLGNTTTPFDDRIVKWLFVSFPKKKLSHNTIAHLKDKYAPRLKYDENAKLAYCDWFALAFLGNGMYAIELKRRVSTGKGYKYYLGESWPYVDYGKVIDFINKYKNA